MTEQEALDWFQDHAELSEANRVAITNLCFRIPRRPLRSMIHYPHQPDLETAQCPYCLRRLRTKRSTKTGDTFCPTCGQAIDWTQNS